MGLFLYWKSLIKIKIQPVKEIISIMSLLSCEVNLVSSFIMCSILSNGITPFFNSRLFTPMGIQSPMVADDKLTRYQLREISQGT